MITAETVRELLSYDPETGVFKWKVRVSKKVRIGDIAGHARADGYCVIRIRGKFYLAHRLAHLMMTGSWPNGDIDHINGSTSDNCWVNLRDVSRRDNLKNSRRRNDNTSGVTGVTRRYRKWRVEIRVNKKQIHLGSYEDFFEAVCARKSAERRYDFHPNHGRAAA